MVSAAIRLLPLSNSECQSMLHRLHLGISEQLDDIRDRSWREMSAFTPELDIVSISHQYDDLRMFAS
jgi:urease accessory protein UreF